MKSASFLFFLYISVCFLTGCGRQQQGETIKQICISHTSRSESMQATRAALADIHFSIAKSDDKIGYIKTRPLRGGQWFELWRKDNVNADSAMEANLHTIRRTAELRIETKTDGQECISCEVTVQRLALFNTSEDDDISQKCMAFSGSTSSLKKQKVGSWQKVWLDLGTDEELSTKILQLIEKKLSK